MKIVAEYTKHAAECRALAKNMPHGDSRDQLLEMAKTWEVLARERERTLKAVQSIGLAPEPGEVKSSGKSLFSGPDETKVSAAAPRC